MIGTCELCGNGETSIQFEEVEYHYKNNTHLLSIQFHLCNRCSSEYANFEDAIQNLRRVNDIKTLIDFPSQNTP